MIGFSMIGCLGNYLNESIKNSSNLTNYAGCLTSKITNFACNELKNIKPLVASSSYNTISTAATKTIKATIETYHSIFRPTSTPLTRAVLDADHVKIDNLLSGNSILRPISNYELFKSINLASLSHDLTSIKTLLSSDRKTIKISQNDLAKLIKFAETHSTPEIISHLKSFTK